ncbi:MAG: 16S rRNA (cytidine(1402)-2'-O)-methyltransferase [Clostridiales bacterium]|jgi:16S rRNA (cytidine1402-2'-O)-methyltransferase|nr:16S rRNA (cytidine(1402)-2'-O)-methyltransferase [Clostridiales bacterium]
MSAIYIVGTPIGNLKDITYRAVETLQAADLIACEDTRRSLVLLNRYGIKKPLIAYHKFNERECAERLLAAAEAGKNVALITDAGLPCVSDPGTVLVNAARERGIKIEVVGAGTALIHALIGSGRGGGGFYFAGFLPDRGKGRRAFLEGLKPVRAPLIFYSAPHDLNRDLKDLFAAFGARCACLARELTKLYEEVAEYVLNENPDLEARGEYVLVIEGAGETANPLLALPPAEHLKAHIAAGLPTNEAVKRTARERGVAKNEIYKLALPLNLDSE